MTPPKLAQALDDFNANDLGAVLSEAGVTDVPKLKHQKVRLWINMVGDPARIQRALAGLAPGNRRALELLQGVDGEMRTERFRSLLVRAGVVSPKTEDPYGYTYKREPAPAKKEPDLPQFRHVLASLLQSGLIWTHTLPEGQPGNAKIGFDGGRFVYIPDEVASHLPPPPIKENPLPRVAQSLEGSARTCQRDLYLLWSAAREAPLQLTNAGLLRVSDLKRVAGQLLVAETIIKGAKEDDYRRILFLRQLATALEALRHNAVANRLDAHPAPPFIAATPAERVRLSFQRWRDGAWWNELWATAPHAYTNETPVTSTSPKIANARRAVLNTLALLARRAEQKEQSPAPWVAVDDINDYLRDRNDEFLVERSVAEQRGSSYGYRYRYYGTSFYSPYEYNSLGWAWATYRSDEEAGWKGVERVFIQTALSEGLYWLGLVDLGYARPVTAQGGAAPGEVVAVRLTDMGRWLLLDGPPPEIPEESGRVVVQPNFRIFAFDPISDAVLARLDSFANRQNAERAIEYELSRETLYRAQLAGQSAGQIQAWLEQVTGAPLPQNVARSLAEWQAAFERITVHSRVGWLEAAAPELIDALLHDRRWSQAIVKRATPTGLIVRADRIDELEQALLAAGELPARNRDSDTARRASIRVDESGQIAFVHATPSLYVYGYLRPFCEQSEAGWQITPRSVAQASAAGLDAASILAHLEAMAVGGVPPALQARIKAWSRHYGAATVQTLTLVQFRDQDALDELRSDAALARYLKPFKPEAKLGLAVVAPEDVAAISALLAERGVDVRTAERG
jgi:hypothetical protein